MPRYGRIGYRSHGTYRTFQTGDIVSWVEGDKLFGGRIGSLYGIECLVVLPETKPHYVPIFGANGKTIGMRPEYDMVSVPLCKLALVKEAAS